MALICLDSPTVLDKNVEKNGRYDVYFQDKALESTGNYKYSPFLPQKTMLKSGWIISDPD